MKQATEEELEGLMNGWRELRVGEALPERMKARFRGRDAYGRRYPWEDAFRSHPAAYDPDYHRILCVKEEP